MRTIRHRGGDMAAGWVFVCGMGVSVRTSMGRTCQWVCNKDHDVGCGGVGCGRRPTIEEGRCLPRRCSSRCNIAAQSHTRTCARDRCHRRRLFQRNTPDPPFFFELEIENG